MKLKFVEIKGSIDWVTSQDTLQGYVTFQGTSGSISLPLTQKDILEVEQLLRGKLQDLAGEL